MKSGNGTPRALAKACARQRFARMGRRRRKPKKGKRKKKKKKKKKQETKYVMKNWKKTRKRWGSWAKSCWRRVSGLPRPSLLFVQLCTSISGWMRWRVTGVLKVRLSVLMLPLIDQKMLFFGGVRATATGPGTLRVLVSVRSVHFDVPSVCLPGSGVVCVAVFSSDHCCVFSVAMGIACERGRVRGG
jgi:hypothetical protein